MLMMSIGICGSANAAPAELSLLGIRFGQHTEKTRVVLDLSGPTSFRAFLLGQPHRVVIDLQPMASRVGAVETATSGLIRGFRFGNLSKTVSRVVLEVSGPVQIKRSFLLPPDAKYGHRLVLDLRRTVQGVTPAPQAEALGPPATGPRSKSKPLPLPNPHRRQVARTIVIDAGHGGVDPGAIGANGVYEKNITLTFAQELKSTLEVEKSYRVRLTRSDDIYIRLRDRISIAREAGADLFISLHADSLGRSAIRGASVYTLSENASDDEAAALAAKENRSDIIAGVDLTRQNDEVTSILIDLTQRETMNSSARYANLILSEFRKSVRVLRKSHRFAGFAVLKAPDVPSVLVELGYLSNPEDVSFLSSRKGRRELVNAIVLATRTYFNTPRQ